jgi:hypothetical protein
LVVSTETSIAELNERIGRLDLETKDGLNALLIENAMLKTKIYSLKLLSGASILLGLVAVVMAAL